jgi:hypothetical protein
MVANPALSHHHTLSRLSRDYRFITICLILKLPKAGMSLTIIFIGHI